MLRLTRTVVFCVTTAAAGGMLIAPASAGTIVKLALGGDPAPDVRYDGTMLATMDDGDAGTTGLQNTDADFQDFLGAFPDVLTSTASFSLGGLTPSGPATVFGGVLVIQNFSGGTFELYDPANQLLLSGALTTSSLTGPLGPPATGALFTTSIASVTGGLLAPMILPNSLSLSMSFTEVNTVNGGVGFSVGAAAPVLNPFTANATLNIAASPIPEPAMAALLAIGGLLTGLTTPRRRGR